MNLKGKKVLVVGLARTGQGTARFLAAKGARVKVSDNKPAEELKSAHDALRDLPLEWETGKHTSAFFQDSELIVVSPGVPPDIEPLVKAREKGIPVLSEVEVAFRFLKRPVVAITGTNG
ncbi:MAG TPA: NAD(P)-dependent oxidoreductase, partial [Thermodesulfobacteriota bacterium]|nr:NAD(P)-dependent oxidoreductase [Thermodesulfobacteriota bacterium]